MKLITIPKGEDFKKDLVLRFGQGEKATVIEYLDQKSSAPLSYSRKIEAAADSEIRFITIQSLPETVELKESLESVAGENAHVHFFTFHLGAKKIESAIFQTGEGRLSRCDTDLVTRTKNSQSFQFQIKNTHSAPCGKGVITAKGVARDESVLGIRGIIKIEQKAGGTDSQLNQAVLNLSPRAKVKATPALEIDTNDVKAAHSASITNLNPEILFYLESRGLAPEFAKKLLMEGFLKESIDKLSDLPEVQKKIYTLL